MEPKSKKPEEKELSEECRSLWLTIIDELLLEYYEGIL
jgi:hypothetical protein